MKNLSKSKVKYRAYRRFVKRKIKFFSENYSIFNVQQFFILIIIVFLLFWLSSPLTAFFNSYVIEYGLGWIPDEPMGLGLGSGYLMLVLFLTYQLRIKYLKSNYKPSLLFIGTVLILCFIYLNERVLRNQYNLTPIFTQNHAKSFLVILDPIIAVSFFFVLYFIYNQINLKIPPRINSFINPDQPIVDKSFDEYDRKEFVEKFSKEIDEILIDSKQSFVIGINGIWGSGKSSLLLMIENELDKNTIKISYNPWITSNNANLVQSFFNLLDEKLITTYCNSKSF